MSNNKKTVQPKIVSPIFVTPRLVEPKAIKIPLDGKSSPPSIDNTWLYFTMPEGGTVTLTKNGTPTEVTLEYSLDNGASWTEWIESGNVRTLTLAAGQTVHVRNTSETSTGFSTGTANYYNFAFTDSVYAYGDTRSLLCSIPSNAVLSVYVFFNLFQGCNTLITSPELPAMSLAQYCYGYMFNGCTSLMTAPELPAMSLANSCYRFMFNGCTSLMTAPELPAMSLAPYCYRFMFNGCTSLVTSPELPAMSLAQYCYANMFNGCTSLMTAPELPAMSLAPYCYGYMFSGCTSLVTSPELPAMTLAEDCYQYMFYGCSSLNEVTMLATDISATNCLQNWLSSVYATGDLYCSAELTIPTGASGIPAGWTRHDI